MTSNESGLLACCADVYGHPLARWFLGASMHPGGLSLTGKLAGLLKLGSDDWVLDVGSGSGTTAVHLARTVGCKVTGVTLEEQGAAAGRELALREGVSDHAAFIQGEFGQVPLRYESFDAVVMECVLSILPDKEDALSLCHSLLRPGGRLGLTDVTVSGPLPPELDGLLSMAGCVGGARSLERYRQMVEDVGFVVDHSQELPEVVQTFFRDVSGKLLMAEAAVALGKLPLDKGVLHEVKRLVSVAREAADQGILSYGLVVAHS